MTERLCQFVESAPPRRLVLGQPADKDKAARHSRVTFMLETGQPFAATTCRWQGAA